LLERVPDFYERLRKSYDDRFYRQEVLGEYINNNGHQVYSAFERGKNVKTLAAQEDLPLLWTLDFNVDPMCSLVVQITGSEIRVLDEIVLKRASTADACAEFSRRFGNRPRRVIVYGDATGNRWQTAGSSDYQVIRDHFSRQSTFQMSYRVPRSNPSVRDRIGLMNTKLCDAAGVVGLWIDGKCRELIRDLEEVSYRVDSGEIDKHKDPSRTHLSDALGYLLWQEFGPRQPIGEQQKRLI